MTKYVLDTDMLTLVQENHPTAGRRFLEHVPEEVAITVLSVQEQLWGWYSQLRKAKSAERLAWAYGRLTNNVRFLSRLQVLTYDMPAIKRFENLRKLKPKIGRMDLRIAAIVLENKSILVTRNVRDFKKVPGMVIEDWSEERETK
jgi:tRNA(fMet)-specific endonuclease VapC